MCHREVFVCCPILSSGDYMLWDMLSVFGVGCFVFCLSND